MVNAIPAAEWGGGTRYCGKSQFKRFWAEVVATTSPAVRTRMPVRVLVHFVPVRDGSKQRQYGWGRGKPERRVCQCARPHPHGAPVDGQVGALEVALVARTATAEIRSTVSVPSHRGHGCVISLSSMRKRRSKLSPHVRHAYS